MGRMVVEDAATIDTMVITIHTDEDLVQVGVANYNYLVLQNFMSKVSIQSLKCKYGNDYIRNCFKNSLSGSYVIKK